MRWENGILVGEIGILSVGMDIVAVGMGILVGKIGILGVGMDMVSVRMGILVGEMGILAVNLGLFNKLWQVGKLT